MDNGPSLIKLRYHWTSSVTSRGQSSVAPQPRPHGEFYIVRCFSQPTRRDNEGQHAQQSREATQLQTRLETLANTRKRARTETPPELHLTLRDKPHRRGLTPTEQTEVEREDAEWRAVHNIPRVDRCQRRSATLATPSVIRQHIARQSPSEDEMLMMRDIKANFGSRNALFQCTPRHEHNRERFAALWGMTAEHRVAAFTSLAQECAWDTSTQKGYWQVLLGALPGLQQLMPKLAVTPLDERFMRILSEEHKTAPPKPPNVFSPPEIVAACRTLRRQENLQAAVALELAYTSLQRLPDIMQAEHSLIVRVKDVLAIPLHQGKVANRTGTWTIHASGPLARDIEQLKLVRVATTSTKLFDANAQKVIRTVLPRDVPLTGVRKGGAIAQMLQGNTTLADTQKQMRHKEPSMTIMYLGRGVYDMEAATRATNIAAAIGIAARIRQ